MMTTWEVDEEKKRKKRASHIRF